MRKTPQTVEFTVNECHGNNLSSTLGTQKREQCILLRKGTQKSPMEEMILQLGREERVGID